jgi:preprotein translocase subunit SecY
MLATIIRKITLILRDSNLRNRILFVLGALALFRILATIPVPGVDHTQLAAFLSQNEFFGFLNIFSGGGLANLSIVMLGVGPYITASIIMQLLSVMSPQVKALYTEEGEAGRQKFTQYSRMLSVPLAFLQALGFLTLLTTQGVLESMSIFPFILNVIVVATGSIFLMWIGELVSEFGIGNGVSLLIFAGIVATLPSTISQLVLTYDPSQIPLYIAFVLAALVVTAAVIFITDAERPVPVTYARQSRGGGSTGGVSSYLPIRVNQAGVIPIIFALSILLFPQMLFQFMSQSGNADMVAFAQQALVWVNNEWIYGAAYFIFVFFFTYFYTAVTFDPQSIANNLQKSGAFVPGVRPGNATVEYLAHIVTRVTFMGALFLGAIAVLPIIVQGITGIQALAIGGTALLIVVSVILDVVRKTDAQLSAKEY